MRKLRLREVKDFPKIVTSVSSHCYSSNRYLPGILGIMDDWTIGVTSCPSRPRTLPVLATGEPYPGKPLSPGHTGELAALMNAPPSLDECFLRLSEAIAFDFHNSTLLISVFSWEIQRGVLGAENRS